MRIALVALIVVVLIAVAVVLTLTLTGWFDKEPTPILTDSFNLALWDDVGYNNWFTTYDVPRPFNEYGVYWSKLFFLKASEAVYITLMSDCLISLEGTEDESSGTLIAAVVLQKGSASVSYDPSRWYKSYELKRLDNEWELTVAFDSDEAGRYQLVIINGCYQPSWCEYTISLR